MTIKELKNLFTNDTEITIVSRGVELDYSTFAEMPLMIQSVQAVGENEVVAEVDMPVEVLRAWKKYSDDYYKE